MNPPKPNSLRKLCVLNVATGRQRCKPQISTTFMKVVARVCATNAHTPAPSSASTIASAAPKRFATPDALACTRKSRCLLSRAVCTVSQDVSQRLMAITQGSEEHTSELQSPLNLVCRLLLEKKKK